VELSTSVMASLLRPFVFIAPRSFFSGSLLLSRPIQFPRRRVDLSNNKLVCLDSHAASWPLAAFLFILSATAPPCRLSSRNVSSNEARGFVADLHYPFPFFCYLLSARTERKERNPEPRPNHGRFRFLSAHFCTLYLPVFHPGQHEGSCHRCFSGTPCD